MAQTTAVEWLEQIIKHCQKYNRHIEQKDIDNAKEVEKEQMGNQWISVEDKLPAIKVGLDYSDNVLVWCNDILQVMCYCHTKDDDNEWCTVWCKVYDGLDGFDGDGEFDDNYYPTHWMPLPNKPLN